jgi:hypothetical protein
MSATQLRQLLAKGSMVSSNLQDTATLCRDWYLSEPSVTTFILRSVFEDLISRDWDDPQGVPTAAYTAFKDGVVPHLVAVADALIASPAAEPIAEVDALTVAYRDFLQTVP